MEKQFDLSAVDSPAKEILNLDFSKRQLNGKLKAFNFLEGGETMLYIPSLELSAYGDTLDEANDMMKNHVFTSFIDSIFEENEAYVYEALEELGWIRNARLKNSLSKISNLTGIDILEDFDLPSNTVIEESLIEI
ncbi:hypothetical protein [Sphingobacterium hungaricum]|uniref:Uncharacterized protein n=1 Tax=Sphingobacterium hungaricum TaxID=2082723 RepID=A0A928YRF5_9SPHI|nr:hypothetical protein [Sphingobacterium hungaricum]MBE8714105.1 hypothetical protein [Sphingobacterium hungaricum]